MSRLGDLSSQSSPGSPFKVHKTSYNVSFTAYNKLEIDIVFTKVNNNKYDFKNQIPLYNMTAKPPVHHNLLRICRRIEVEITSHKLLSLSYAAEIYTEMYL